MYLVLYFLTISAIIIVNLAVEPSYLLKLEKDRSSVINHNRQQSVVTFPLTAIPLTEVYSTRVKLGNPPKEFRVLVDSGSDILWVPCNGCNKCPLKSTFSGQPLSLFDPQQSSTASVISCLDKRCIYSNCSGDCSYAISYINGDTKGYFVSDEIQISMRMESKWVTNSSIRILFGCTNFVSGNLASPYVFYDGVLGLRSGSGLSILSQLSSAGVSPMVFFHCFSRSEVGGILVLGEAVEPGIMYTRLCLSEFQYHLYLKNIIVNGLPLHIDSSIFKISSTTGTIIDSGTSFAYLPKEVYNHFVNAIYSSVRPSQVQSIMIDSIQCFQTYISIYEAFPLVILKFDDGAIMELNPSNYLRWVDTFGTNNRSTWCIAWSKHTGGKGAGLIRLGDIVLKDKIIIYDLIHQRLGWKHYNCSLPINVSTSTIIEPINNHRGGNILSKWSKYGIFAEAILGLIIIIVIIVMIIYRFR